MLYTDISNAEKFVSMFGEKVRWSRDYGGWFIYNGKYWERDSNGTIKQYAIKVHKQLHKEVQEFEGDDAALAAFSRHVKASGANGKLEAMLDCSKAFLGVPQSSFDARESLFNLDNRTIDLEPDENGLIRPTPFDPEHLLTKMANVSFNGKSACPMWEKFLDDIFLGNQDMIDFMQRVIGYSMTSSTKEQCLFILYGCGRNGKSIFTDTIAHMFGDYAVNCPTNALIKKNYTGGIPNDVAALKGARFVTATESNQNVTLDEALIKQLTGSDKITARFLHKEFFEFRPTFKIFIATNHKPNIRGTDTGIWRRIRMIPFDLRITDANDDRNLLKKLRTELPGIFVWAVKGYKKWLQDGLKTPKIIFEATCNYQDEEDDLGQFIKDYCIMDEEGTIPVHDFKKKFRDINGYFKSQKVISEYMSRNNITSRRHTVNGSQSKCWEGIKFPSIMDN